MYEYERYGIRVGQVYSAADGISLSRLTVVDVDTHRVCADVVVRDELSGVECRIDAFKLAMVRYKLVNDPIYGPYDSSVR